MIEARQLVRPELLLRATFDGPGGPNLHLVVLSCRYVPAVDVGGRVGVAIELAFDPAVPQPTGYYYCPVERIERLLLAPDSLKALAPYDALPLE